jgi:hypothetical protein
MSRVLHAGPIRGLSTMSVTAPIMKGTDPGADAAVAIVYSTDFLGVQQRIGYSATMAVAMVHNRPRVWWRPAPGSGK